MPAQPNFFSKPPPAPEARAAFSQGEALPTASMEQGGSQPSSSQPSKDQDAAPAPIWLQRISLFVLVMFCLYLGLLVTVLPWWPRVWDQNLLLLAHPKLGAVLQNGIVRGVISGVGLLDIWIGLSEAIHYRDYRG